MKRVFARIAAVGLAAALLAAAGPKAVGAPPPDPPCRTAILTDLDTGTVLYEKEADRQVPIASITKVMTLLLAFEAMENGKVSLQDIVPVSEHAYNMGGSQIWLEPGEQLTLDEMIRAICVASANDAAVAVAEFIGGSEPAFVAMMNQKAAELGMTGTTFCNACGLDQEGHLSTARDVAIMSREILTRYPGITKYTTIWQDSLRGGATQLVNTNKLLRRYRGITGLKTGTTGGAGVCISASACREGLSLLAVVLGSSSGAERFTAATQLLDYGFANYESAPCPPLEGAPLYLAVKGGAAPQTALSYAVPGSFLTEKGKGGELTAQVELPETVIAPVSRGQRVGSVTVRMGDTVLGEYPIAAENDIPAMTWRDAMRLLLECLLGRAA